MKTCGKCKASKALAEFYKNKTKKDGLQTKCKACSSTSSKAWAKANPEKAATNKAAWNKANPEKIVAYSAAWYAANKDHHNANGATWRKANPEKIVAYSAAWYAANKDLSNANGAAWAKANPEKNAAKEHRRRARMASNGVNLVTATETATIIAKPCMACAAPAPSTVEHLIPISRGGAHTIGNLAPLCQPCNSSKNDMTWAEWKHSNRAQAKKAFGL